MGWDERPRPRPRGTQRSAARHARGRERHREPEPDVKPLLPLIQALRVQASDASVHLSFEQDTSTLVRMLTEARGGDAEESADSFRHRKAPGDQRWY